MIQLPQIDLNGILPVAGLAVIAVVCILALLASVLLRSRIVLLIAVVIGVVVAGPTLAVVLRDIIWALVPLGVVIIIGLVAGLWVLSRNPELMALVRDVAPRRTSLMPPAETPPTVIDQLPAAQTNRAVTVRRTMVSQDGDRWGF